MGYQFNQSKYWRWMHDEDISVLFYNQRQKVGVPRKYFNNISSNNEVKFEFFSKHNSFAFTISKKYIFISESPILIFGRKFFQTEKGQFSKRGWPIWRGN